jgi:hypothetical protein
MAKLEHANIVKCYGGNLEGSNPFIVTELCMCSLDKVGGMLTDALAADALA